MERLKKDLGLTDDQCDQLKANLKTHLKEGKSIGEKMKSDVQTVKKDLSDNAPEKKLTLDLEKYSEDHTAWEDSESAFRKNNESILTLKQRAQMTLDVPGMGVASSSFFDPMVPSRKDIPLETSGQSLDGPGK